MVRGGAIDFGGNLISTYPGTIRLATIGTMNWNVEFHLLFVPEFQALPQEVQDEILSRIGVLEQFGPALGRPNVDTLNGSKYKNMKELRFDVDDGVWRLAFAFDVRRRAILLVAGDKAGVNQKRFYQTLIKKADDRFKQHLQTLEDSQP